MSSTQPDREKVTEWPPRRQACNSSVLHIVIIDYMQKHSQPTNEWWHERPTKIADLPTGYQVLSSTRPVSNDVWPKATFVVCLMFALVLSLISLMTGQAEPSRGAEGSATTQRAAAEEKPATASRPQLKEKDTADLRRKPMDVAGARHSLSSRLIQIRRA